MNLITKRFKEIFEANFGHGGDNKTPNHHYHYERKNLGLEELTFYVIQVYRDLELWKTFWISNERLSARILENWNELSERQRYCGTQKTIASYQTAEEFEKVISKLRDDIFN